MASVGFLIGCQKATIDYNKLLENQLTSVKTISDQYWNLYKTDNKSGGIVLRETIDFTCLGQWGDIPDIQLKWG